MDNLKNVFSKIYDKYIDKIYRFIFLKVNVPADAEDLCSETFLRLWQRLNQNPGPKVPSPSEGPDKTAGIENIQAFLYKIARNLTIDYYRQKGKVQFVSTENVSIADPRQNLEEKINLKSDLEAIKISLVGLKEDYQNVIIWRYLDDLPVPEIALLLDRTEDATRVLLCRALNALRSTINNEQLTTNNRTI